MKSKRAFILLAGSILLFASGPIGRLTAYKRSYNDITWAQDATDSAQAPDASTEPAVTLPDLQGTWSGAFDDDSLGVATLTADIFQNHSKLKGTYLVNGKKGPFTGKIRSDGFSVLFVFKGNHKCVTTAPGTLVTQNEITGTYTSKHCSITSGTYTLFRE